MMENKNNNLLKNLLISLVIFLALASIFASLGISSSEKIETITLDSFVRQLNEGKIKTIEVEESKLNLTTQDDIKETVVKEMSDSFSSLIKNLDIAPGKISAVSVSVKDTARASFWLGGVFPFLLPLLIIGGFIYFMARQIQKTNNRAMMFGQTKTPETIINDQHKKASFRDVAGVKEAKQDLMEVVEFLKNPKKFESLGARIPKGVLLLGPPGTGKTLLARAVAGEANVPFFHISGSEFVEMFVGVGASRVRDLFRKAKKNAPSIIFIDEMDAVGRQRGTGLGGSHDEREQTLNQILVEMDGFETDTHVIVIAATNRPDVLDPALLRPGRFDRRVMFDLPDIDDREAILKIHAQNKPLFPSADLRTVAKRTPGFSGADLANILNEAAILTARRNKKLIDLPEILESIEKVMLGPERRSHILSEKEKNIVAYHEAGHALVAHQLPNCDPVRKISIISRGRAAGYTLKMPEREQYLHSKSKFTDDIASLLGGYAAEREVFKEVTTGAANDLREATNLARKLVTQYGMSDALGPQTFGEREELIFLGREITEQRNYSEKIAQTIDQEIANIIGSALAAAQDTLHRLRPKLDGIAKALLEKETIESEEFENLLIN